MRKGLITAVLVALFGIVVGTQVVLAQSPTPTPSPSPVMEASPSPTPAGAPQTGYGTLAQ
jgi:hypothetical protein